jgi:hypothetical protein
MYGVLAIVGVLAVGSVMLVLWGIYAPHEEDEE